MAKAIIAMVPEGVSVTALTRQQLDITKADAVHSALAGHAPDVLINAAAFTNFAQAEIAAGTAMLINGEAVQNLSSACATVCARLVQISSDYVFDGKACTPYCIDARPNPISVYGRSKLAGEQAALARSSALVVRTAWVYGERGEGFVAKMLGQMASAQDVHVVADQFGTPTHVSTLARIVWALIAAGSTGIRHATNSGSASWYEFALAIQGQATALGLLDNAVPVQPIGSEAFPLANLRPQYSVLDKSETWGDLGQPAVHWREPLQCALARLADERE